MDKLSDLGTAPMWAVTAGVIIIIVSNAGVKILGPVSSWFYKTSEVYRRRARNRERELENRLDKRVQKLEQELDQEREESYNRERRWRGEHHIHAVWDWKVYRELNSMGIDYGLPPHLMSPDPVDSDTKTDENEEA